MTEQSVDFRPVVGETIRAKLPGQRKAKRRAVIATAHPDGSCLVLWENETPRPIIAPVATNSSSKARFLRRLFLVSPIVEGSNDDDSETILSKDQMESLLPFETSSDDKHKDIESIAVWKDRGDQLLKLGDAVAAIPYYEIALRLSSAVQIGGSILLKQGGKMKVADVDCIDEDTIDVALQDSGEERTLTNEKDIHLCVLEPDDERFQERILLNLTRCFLQIAEMLTTRSLRPKFLQSAYLSCTLAMSLNSLHSASDDASTSPSSTVKSALLLRGKAYASLNKFQYAIADMKRLLALDPPNKEAKRRLREFERQKIESAKSEKKLVKEMCQWVQEQVDTNNNEEPSSVSSRSDSVERNASRPHCDSRRPPTTFSRTQSTSYNFSPWISLLIGVALAWLAQKVLK